jgi:hypothetical protein
MSNTEPTLEEVYEIFHKMVTMSCEAVPIIESRVINNINQIRTEKNNIISAWASIIKQNNLAFSRDKQITDILMQWKNNVQKDDRYTKMLYIKLDEYVEKIKNITQIWHEWSKNRTLLYDFKPLSEFYGRILQMLRDILQTYFHYHYSTIYQEEKFVNEVIEGKRNLLIFKKDMTMSDVSEKYNLLQSRYRKEQEIIKAEIERIKKESVAIQSELKTIEGKIVEWLQSKPIIQQQNREQFSSKILNDFDSMTKKNMSSISSLNTMMIAGALGSMGHF